MTWQCCCCIHDLYKVDESDFDDGEEMRNWATLDEALRDLLPDEDEESLATWLNWRATAYPNEQAEILSAIARVRGEHATNRRTP